jgi:hypothetical protein
MPPTNSSPNFHKGDIPTADTWDNFLSAKVDSQGGQIDSPTITGTGQGTPTWAGLHTFNAGIAVASIISAALMASTSCADDTAAAAAGVPVGGFYRNGNFIMIRLS